jgi:hypothetical protein
MKYILTTVLSLFVVQAFAQPPDTVWTRVFYGGNEAEAFSVQLTTDGGYVLAGWTRINSLPMAFILKTDSLGNLVWNWQDNPAETHVSGFYSARQTHDGGYIAFGGVVENQGERMKMYLRRFTSEGDTVWTRTWPDSGLSGAWEGGEVVQTNAGFAVTGIGIDGLVRLDSLGNVIWSRDLGGEVKSVVALPDGGFACSGTQNETGGVFLIRTDTAGDSLWFHYYGGGFDGHGNQLIRLADGGYAVCGYNSFIRTDSSGDVLWESQSSLFFGNLMAVAGTLDGGFLTAGCRGSADCNVFVAKYDSSGDTLWTKMWGGSLTDLAHAVQQVSDSCYVVAGRYGYAEPNPWIAAYLAKLRESTPSSSPLPSALPLQYSFSAFPNPFNPTANIAITLPHTSESRLTVYDITGREVCVIHEGVLGAGEHRFTFDGAGLPSGIYFARLESAGLVKTQKLLLLK